MPSAISYPYGHPGGGNIHFNISQPADMNNSAFLNHWKSFNGLIHGITHKFHGSFSAEHGIGISKLEEMEIYKEPQELDLYRKIKNLLDPDGIMHPGKVIKTAKHK